MFLIIRISAPAFKIDEDKKTRNFENQFITTIQEEQEDELSNII